MSLSTSTTRCVSSFETRDREGSMTTKLKGFFAGFPKRKSESRKAVYDLRRSSASKERSNQSELSLTCDTAAGARSSISLTSFSNKYDFVQEVPVSPARFSIPRDSRNLHRPSIDSLLSPTSTQDRAFFPCLTTDVDGGYDIDSACRTALAIPEIVEAILSQLEEATTLSMTTTKNNSINSIKSKDGAGPLFSCLNVNTMFSAAASRIISRKVALHDMDQVAAYLRTEASHDNLCRDLLVHRIKTCQQEDLNRFGQFRLRSLELYVCPQLIPTEAMLERGTLIKIALPGCALIDDQLMYQIAKHCKQLEILDLRACELVSDAGIIAIANSCARLSYLNVGRIKKSGAITDKSIIEICKKTSVETLGLAGCSVGNESVAAIARYRGPHIERLSMNQCHQISDRPVSELLRSAPRLQVLEVVGCELLQDARTMCFFKLSTGALVETSDVFAIEMQLFEREVKHELDRLKQRVIKSQRRVTA